MKIALITTTINIPTVLALYRKLGPDVAFFVAIDEKTPEDAINFCQYDLDKRRFASPGEKPAEILWYQDQQKYKCSELLGWNNDSRRNIALLEAVKWGAEIIVSIDDDMIPTSPDFFQRIEDTLTLPFSGLQVGCGQSAWVDVGEFSTPIASQRGFPIGYDDVPHQFSFVHEAQVGALQGIILGVADTDAVTALAKRPLIYSASDILREGFVVDPKAKAVFNSQLTAFRREMAPCFAQFYKWQGRNTDIFASLVMRRVMREFNLYTYFGPPFGFHARSQRDPLKDLKAEMWGVEHVAEFQQWLNDYVYMSDDKTPLDATYRVYDGMSDNILPRENIDCALTFLEDMKGVL